MRLIKETICIIIIISIISLSVFATTYNDPFLGLFERIGISLLWSGLVIIGWILRGCIFAQNKEGEEEE